MRIQKEIENVERIENRQPVEPLTMEDAVIQHKKAVDKYEEERKEINKELDLDDDIVEKGFTGASKEPKKVSTPELKKMKLSESLFKSLNEELEDTDGWGDEIEYTLDGIFSELENLMYEVRNCRRGSYTDCETADELAAYIHRLADDLDECSQEINANRNSINESSNENPDQEIRKIIQILKDDESEDAYLDAVTDMDNRFERYFGEDNYYNRYDGKPLKALTYYPLKQAEVLLRKLKRIAKKYNIKLDESLNEDVESVSIPAPYDKYFELEDEDQLEEYGWTKGEQIPNYDCHILAMLYPKDDEIDVYPILTDDPDYPVCEVAGERLYPVKIQGRWKRLIKDESLNEGVEEINMGELLELVDRYNTSTPVSGDWDTETQHEQKIIADHFNLSMEEAKQVMIDMLGFEEDMFPVEDESLEEAKINRQNQRRKKDAYLQRKEAEREKAEKEARERERIGDAAWGEKDWIAEREKGDLDFSNYSDEEKAEIEKRLKAFDDNPTAKAQYQRKKEAEEAKRAEEERKKAEQEKEERTKKNLERIGKAANAPKDIGNAFKKGLGNAGIHIG